MTESAHSKSELPAVIPVFPLTGAILIPGGTLPLNIFEPRYLQMVRDALKGDELIGMIQPLSRDESAGAPPGLYSIGGVGRIVDVEETPDGRILIQLVGLSRFEIAEELAVTTPYRQVQANWQPYSGDTSPAGGRQNINRDALMATLDNYLTSKGLAADFGAITKAPDDVLVNTLAMIVPFGAPDKQALLEAGTVEARSRLLAEFLKMATSSTTFDGSDRAH